MAAALAMYNELIRALEHAHYTRYFSAAGLAVLLYDHLLTLDVEIKYVWRAPPSLPKIAFLFNRYMVLGCLLAIACSMCGFSVTFSDTE
ncbi:hypothetical protein EIP91_003690 [Steccherinum ochraceum]|uniref:DUF6533 domain-containing protein n=1 Tax=Steccherinum ochraceum TaxID=92696 RepID=A0A4R0RQP3_9APHY|nr:hypothetical protein EIP91_003690 [Steccherinum ochraceum]